MPQGFSVLPKHGVGLDVWVTRSMGSLSSDGGNRPFNPITNHHVKKTQPLWQEQESSPTVMVVHPRKRKLIGNDAFDPWITQHPSLHVFPVSVRDSYPPRHAALDRYTAR